LDGEEAVRLATEHVPDPDGHLDTADEWLGGDEGGPGRPADEGDPGGGADGTRDAGGSDAGKRGGFASYLTKPIEPRRVLEEIERLTLGKAAAGEPQRAG